MTENPKRAAPQSARQISYWLVCLASSGLGIYLWWLFGAVPRNGTAYPYMHYLFDYSNGISRRALEGEIVRHLVSPPLTEEGFTRFTFTLEAIALLLVFAAVVLGLLKRRSRAMLLTAALLVVSPAGLKNILYDHGRQDVFGLILILILLLLQIAGARRAAFWVFAITLVPLCLVADNQLLLYVPLGLLMTAVDWETEGFHLVSRAWVPVALAIFALSLSFLLPVPHVTPAQYEHYLRIKSATPLGDGMPWNWIYRNTGENLQFSHRELGRLIEAYRLRTPEILFSFAVTASAVALVYLSLGNRPTDQRRYLMGVGLIALGYLALYVLASDWSRWTSNLNCALWLFGLFLLSQKGMQSRTPLLAGLLWIVVAFQLFDASPLGIVTPTYVGISDLLRSVDLALGTRWEPRDPIYIDADRALLNYSRHWGPQTSVPLFRGRVRSFLGIHPQVPHATFRLPTGPHGPVEPLLVSGLPGLQNFIYVYYAGPAVIQICYESEGNGGPLSAQFAVDQSIPHQLSVINGADLPIARDPFWSGVERSEIADTRSRMIVLFDGHPVLDSRVPPHPSGGLFYWGCSPAETPFGNKFSGAIVDRTPCPLAPRPSPIREDVQAYGPVEVTVGPMRFGSGTEEPLLSLGYQHEDAALVAIARIDARHFILSYREAGRAAETSAPFEADDARPHRVAIHLPSLCPPATSFLWQHNPLRAHRQQLLSTKLIEWDGYPVLKVTTSSPSISPSSLVPGVNAVEFSGVAPSFDGPPPSLRRVPWPE